MFTVWIWLIPPWVRIEKTTVHDWPMRMKTYPGRRLEYRFKHPFVVVQDVPFDRYNSLARHVYPEVCIRVVITLTCIGF